MAAIGLYQVARGDWGDPQFLQERFIKIQRSPHHDVFILDQV